MFAIIDVSTASKIVINIPLDGADKSLPALAAMFEKNAVFVRQGYKELDIVKPDMSIMLGDSVTMHDNYKDIELVINQPQSSDVISDDFSIASPDVFVRISNAMSKNAEEMAKVKRELEAAKSENAVLKDKINAILEGTQE